MNYLLCRTVLFLTLFTVISGMVFGKGQQDTALSRADELIASKRYSEALNILVPYARENPKEFDAAQKRIKQILFFRDKYNVTAQQLLDELEKEKPSDPVILALSNQLMELDPERIAETQDFIGRTRDVALFRTNQQSLDRILNEGQALADRGSYTEAFRTYAGGLDIYQAEFFSGEYGTAMQNRARQNIASVSSNIGAVSSSANALEEAVNALEALSGQGIEPQNLTAYRNAYNRLSAEMDRFTALRNSFSAANASFRDDLTELRRNNPRQGDRNFLAFAVRLMEGRTDRQGGMLGAFDTIWDKAISRARELLDQKSQTAYSATVNDAARQEYGGLGPRSEALAAYSSFPEDLVIRWGRYDLAQKPALFNQSVPAAEAGNFLKFRALRESAAQWRSLGQLGTRYAVIPNQNPITLLNEGTNGEELIRAEQNTGNVLRQIRTDAQTLLASIQRDSAAYREEETRYPNSGSLDYINGVFSATEELINTISIAESGYSVRRYTLANSVMENRISEREAELREAAVQFQGTQKGGYIAKYPTSAGNILTRMDASIEGDRQALQTLIGQYNTDPPAIAGNPEIRPLREAALAMQTRLEGTRSQGRSMAATARLQAADAESLRREGDRFYNEARTALSRNDFETALNRIDRAGTAYYQSLELEDDEATRLKRDTAVPELSAVIAEAYSRDVLRRMDELIAQIQKAYNDSEFEQAEQLVTRARNIWRQTQTVEHAELEHWAGMIQAGLRSGRTIPPTAPLYAEMSQLLSDARKNFEEGQVLFISSEPEGTRMLNNARANIEKVKLVYPMNEEAGILGLQIDQKLEKDFPVTLNAKIESIIARTKTGTQNSRIQAVNELRNYAAVFPLFINWNPIIFQAEVDAEIRPPPPSAIAVAQAAEIVAMARQVIASGNTERTKEIQSELGRAMVLDPGNQEARILFRQISEQVSIRTTVLDSESERIFLQATQALTQNNPIRARQLLRDIYARNQDYQNIEKVVTLQRRVDSML